VLGEQVVPVNLGTRHTLADVGATVADYFHTELTVGTSFLGEVAPWMTP
jgi:phosphopentomutase